MLPLATIIALLPELLVTLPKIGEAIHRLLSLNSDQLDDEQRAALANVKVREAAEDDEWTGNLKSLGR